MLLMMTARPAGNATADAWGYKLIDPGILDPKRAVFGGERRARIDDAVAGSERRESDFHLAGGCLIVGALSNESPLQQLLGPSIEQVDVFRRNRER